MIMEKTKNEIFIEKAKKVHGDKYDYSKVNYIDSKTKVCIICPEHGEFWQTPSSHLSKRGCPFCANNIKYTNEKFIEKASAIHHNRYDYSKTKYVNDNTKVCIICPEHGEFWQTPHVHLKGHGCAECVNKLKLDKDGFRKKSIKIHNNKYDYSKVNYINNSTKVCIICPEHGEFWQTPHSHMRGQGCPKCANKVKSLRLKHSINDFLEKAKSIHNDKYDYSNVNYVDSNTKVCIICPEHGEFWQLPSHHLSGHGCPKCADQRKGLKKLSTLEQFIKKAREIHGYKYDYSKSNYVNNRTKVCIMCSEHGEFWQKPNDHISLSHGCPKCGHQMSKAEDDIIKLLHTLSVEQRNKKIIKPYEIDIFIPSLKLGIEYNGLRWHSEEFGKGHRYHLDKLNKCNEEGVRLIQIFADEWVNHREICESKLKQICGLNTNPKIYGRKCEIREISKKDEVYEFLDKNHIQGRTGFTIGLGAYHEGKLVGVMTFKKEKEGYWDLNRFATDINYQCIGIGGKLFKHFVRNYPFIEIKSFADRRWTIDPTNNLYTKLGFEFDSYVPPTYWYYNQKIDQNKRFHKFSFRKQHLHNQYGLPLTMTEREMTETLGYTRIWDCGLIKYVFKNNLTT